MCCRKLKSHLTYAQALSDAVSDWLIEYHKLQWIRHVIYFLVKTSLLLYHFAMICHDYMNVSLLIEDSIVSSIKSPETSYYVKIVLFIPHIIVYAVARLKNLGFVSLVALIYFVLCKYF